MKIIIAQGDDTLRSIAAAHHTDGQSLLAANPHIKDPDEKIPKNKVHIPSSRVSVRQYPPECNPQMPTEYLDAWIPTTPIEKMAAEEYDALIIGSGAGGSTALYRLCHQWKNKNKKIGMIEAGGLLLSTHAQNVSTLEVERFQQFFLNPKISTPIGWELPQFSGARLVFALGGRTLFWSAVYPRMNEVEFKENDWPISYKDLVGYYNSVEEILRISQDFTKDSLINDILLERLRQNGFPQAINVPIATDISQAKMLKVLKVINAKNSPEGEICLRPPGLDFHEMGTCRMGNDPNTSVTNRYGQVHNVSGLFVADNSVLRYSGAANPTFTMMALAFQTADYIARK